MQALSAVILAGGRGSRLGGADKGLALLHGQPLAARLLEALRPQADEVLINANRNLERYAAFGARVFSDAHADFAGPLAGMQAGLQAVVAEWVLFVPCDVAWIPADLAPRLRAAVGPELRAAYATAQNHPQYACCLLHTDLAISIEEALREGRRSVRDFLATCQAAPVNFADWPAALQNLNTPQDFRACEGARP